MNDISYLTDVFADIIKQYPQNKPEHIKKERIPNSVYSFDIFDTLITRNTAQPDGIFAVMSKTMLMDERYHSIPKSVREHFFNIRQKAELTARQRLISPDIQEITLKQIYDIIAEEEKLSAKQITLLKNLEIQTELDSILPIDINIKMVKKRIEQNKKVILISDMYLPEKVIRSLLEKADKILADLPLYISCEHQKSKYSGDLYKIVQEKENINIKQWVHTGDNLYSDINSASKIGIQPIYYRFELLSDDEEKQLRNNPENADLQLKIGLNRYKRIQNRKEKQNITSQNILKLVENGAFNRW